MESDRRLYGLRIASADLEGAAEVAIVTDDSVLAESLKRIEIVGYAVKTSEHPRKFVRTLEIQVAPSASKEKE